MHLYINSNGHFQFKWTFHGNVALATAYQGLDCTSAYISTEHVASHVEEMNYI